MSCCEAKPLGLTGEIELLYSDFTGLRYSKNVRVRARVFFASEGGRGAPWGPRYGSA